MERDDQKQEHVVVLAARAAVEMGVADGEWRDAGERAALSLLLHVQVAAMDIITGGRSGTEGRNSVAIDSEVRLLMSSGLGGPRGPLANMEMLEHAAAWSSARTSPVLRRLVRPGGPLRRLLDEAGAGTGGNAR